ncbi:MAG TPA: type II toxin-antitoxin system HicA family toxin [Sphingomicrobium sp.]|nr:type II toxin-antitoxin system HicA family toxin [Sphingomicrobium sp.]
MVEGYAKRLKSALRDHGWAFERAGKGDHEVWSKPGRRRVVVDNGMMSRHTANAVLKQAGIKLKF